MMFVRRIGTALVLFWLVVTLTFVLIRLAPGDPAAFLVPPGASEADAARVRAELGLDRSMLVQYARWFLATLFLLAGPLSVLALAVSGLANALLSVLTAAGMAALYAELLRIAPAA